MVPAKKILAWEAAGYIEPLMRRRGRRLVRHYSEGLAAVIARAAALVGQGYRVGPAFKLARQEAEQGRTGADAGPEQAGTTQ